jgi:hypothetical protein
MKKNNNSSTVLGQTSLSLNKLPKVLIVNKGIKCEKTIRSMWLLNWILLFSMFLSCVAVSQEIKDIQDLLNKSDIVVDAQVVSKESKWTEDKRSMVTTVGMKVLQMVKGKIKSNEIMLKIPGGKIGDITVTVHPSSEGFDIQERAIVFIKKYPNEHSEVLSKHPIDGENIYISNQRVNVGQYINVLKHSLTDVSALPKFIDEVKKEAEARLMKPRYEETSKEYANPNKKEQVVEPNLNKSGSQNTKEQDQRKPMVTGKDKNRAPRKDIRDSVLILRREKQP